MEERSVQAIRQAGYEREGFAETYDLNRPGPPGVLLDVLTRAAGVKRPRVVVDLGSGTGLSTRVWADRADEVVGIEPQAPMRERAAAVTEAPNVRYVQGWSYATGLPAGGADVVTCSQSFHWMEPGATLAEAARILRPGGVFAVYDYEVPPFVEPEVDSAFDEYLRARREVRARLGMPPVDKTGHLELIESSSHFRFTRRLLLHGAEDANAERVVGFALSIGPVLEGLDTTLDDLRQTARRVLGDRTVSWVTGYFVYLAVR